MNRGERRAAARKERIGEAHGKRVDKRLRQGNLIVKQMRDKGLMK